MSSHHTSPLVSIQDMRAGFFVTIGSLGAAALVYTTHELVSWGWSRLFSRYCPIKNPQSSCPSNCSCSIQPTVMISSETS